MEGSMKFSRLFLSFGVIAVLLTTLTWAQSPGAYSIYEYSRDGLNLEIRDFSTVTSTITIPDNFTIFDLNVMVDIQHPYAADLTITITGPNGAVVILAAAAGGGTDNFEHTIFDDDAAAVGAIPGIGVTTSGGQFRGYYIPDYGTPLAVFNGLNAAGPWTITVSDSKVLDEGMLLRWGLIFLGPKSSLQYQTFQQDIRVGIDMDAFGGPTFSYPGFGAVMATNSAHAVPPLSIAGAYPLNGGIVGWNWLQHSFSPAPSMIKASLEVSNGGTPVTGSSEVFMPVTLYGIGVVLPLSDYNDVTASFNWFTRQDLFMTHADNSDNLKLTVTPGVLAYDDGVPRQVQSFVDGECDAVAFPVSTNPFLGNGGNKLLTSIDVYHGADIENVVSGSFNITVWDNTFTQVATMTVTPGGNIQGDKWTTYAFNPPVVLTPGWYSFGVCKPNPLPMGSIALGLDEVTTPTNDGVGYYEGLNLQWFFVGGNWYEDTFPFVNKLIRPNFVLGTDPGIVSVDNPIGMVAGPQVPTVTVGSFNHQPQMPVINAHVTVEIASATDPDNVIYTSGRRVGLQAYQQRQITLDQFSAPAAGDYVMRTCIYESHDGNPTNNCVERTFTVTVPGRPVVVSYDGSISSDLKTKIINDLAGKGLSAVFKDRQSTPNPFEDASAVLWLGDRSSMNEEAARTFVHKGNYLSIASRTLMKDRAELLNVFQSDEVARIQQIAEEKAEAAKVALMKATESNTSKFAQIDPTDIPLQFSGMNADEVRRSLDEYQQQMVTGTGGQAPAGIRRNVVSLENNSDVIIGSASIADLTVTTIHLNKGYTPPPVVESKSIPTDFALEQNYPNPFNPSTSIGYLLPVESHVTIKVYDLLGREVATLLNLTQPSGRYLTEWSAIDDFGKEVSSGIYIYRIEAQPVDGSTAPFVATRKMVLTR